MTSYDLAENGNAAAVPDSRCRLEGLRRTVLCLNKTSKLPCRDSSQIYLEYALSKLVMANIGRTVRLKT